MTHTTTDAAEARAREAVRNILTTLVSPECDDEWNAVENAIDAIQRLAFRPPTNGSADAVACRFGGIEYSQADLQIAQRAACAVVPLYGTGDHGEQEAARGGKLWNDHPAVQGALRALHEARLTTAEAASGAAEREGLAWRLERISDDGGPLTLSDKAVLREARAALASLPPATDAALVHDDWLRGDWYERWEDATENADDELMSTLEALRGRVERTILAALAAAPTIPATGDVVPVDPDDLRPWGYAPGGYWFRCQDCPEDQPWDQLPHGDKRSWRCKPHAEAARDASGHAATEGEG